jgi:hypothetical protein
MRSNTAALTFQTLNFKDASRNLQMFRQLVSQIRANITAKVFTVFYAFKFQGRRPELPLLQKPPIQITFSQCFFFALIRFPFQNNRQIPQKCIPLLPKKRDGSAHSKSHFRSLKVDLCTSVPQLFMSALFAGADKFWRRSATSATMAICWRGMTPKLATLIGKIWEWRVKKEGRKK